MIIMAELIKGKEWDKLDINIKTNLETLLNRLNMLREAWGKPMQITSGLRDKDDQIRIYAQKGITDIKQIPMASKHLYGQAADIYDPKFELTEFCKCNDSSILKELCLWAEEDKSAPRLHLQIVGVPSGARWFRP